MAARLSRFYAALVRLWCSCWWRGSAVTFVFFGNRHQHRYDAGKEADGKGDEVGLVVETLTNGNTHTGQIFKPLCRGKHCGEPNRDRDTKGDRHLQDKTDQPMFTGFSTVVSYDGFLGRCRFLCFWSAICHRLLKRCRFVGRFWRRGLGLFVRGRFAAFIAGFVNDVVVGAVGAVIVNFANHLYRRYMCGAFDLLCFFFGLFFLRTTKVGVDLPTPWTVFYIDLITYLVTRSHLVHLQA